MRGYSAHHLSSTKSKEADIIRATNHPAKNVSPAVLEKLGENLHLQLDHPLGIMKAKIETFCNTYATAQGQKPFAIYDRLSPLVLTKNCFDDLLIPPEHVSRRSSDTYYVTDTELLRTHTSAHQCELMRQGQRAFLCSGDVYRRDEVDSSHYPVFHQMEGVKLFDRTVSKKEVEDDLKKILSDLVRHLFGSDCETRWRDDYFPFTTPSFELEVKYQGNWLEVLGCGVIHDQVLRNAGVLSGSGDAEQGVTGWAFGLGLERLAMVLFGIPDIRLFWTKDERFLSQFRAGDSTTKFVPYSKYPSCYKDVSFWLPEVVAGQKEFHVNELYEIVREVAGDIAEKVELFDQFVHPKTKRTSHAYRIHYRHMERNLVNEEVDAIQTEVRRRLVDMLKVTLR